MSIETGKISGVRYNQTVAFLWGCGVMEPEDDDKNLSCNDKAHGTDPVTIDNFDDGNLTAESVGGNWGGYNVSLENRNGVLHSEGDESLPSETVHLRPSTPIKVSNYNYLELDIRGDLGKSFNIQLLYEGNSSHPSPFDERFIPGKINSDDFCHLQLPLEHSSLLEINIYFDVEENKGGWLELDNVKLTK